MDSNNSVRYIYIYKSASILVGGKNNASLKAEVG